VTLLKKTAARIFTIRLLFALILFLNACSESSVTNSDGSGSGFTPPVDNSQKTGFGVSGLLFENNLVMWDRENDGSRNELFSQMYFTRLDASDFPVWGAFPSRYLVSGGVPRDGIPALVNPRFVRVGSSDLDYLQETDLVLGAVINGEAKAYPENILWWHEIINDHIGGQAVIMTLCPLTGTGMLFRAPADADRVDKLELLPVVETTWEKWQELYPNTKAVSRETGIGRDYTAYPYFSYREENVPPLFGIRSGQIDARFPLKHTVLGLFAGEVQKAYPFSRLEGKPVVNDVVNGQNILIVSDLRARLAIPYDRNVDGQVLSFRLDKTAPFTMIDNETGSLWDIKGRAISGQMRGKELPQLPAHNAFWFAWPVFWPQTLVFGE
jgi:hypothetical protein